VAYQQFFAETEEEAIARSNDARIR